jgi:Tol biopolymer transport system component
LQSIEPGTPALAQTPVTLPAPVYLIDGASGQIVRVAADGVTRRTVTHELAPVTAFDVSPDGSLLAYVTGNQLVEAGADGLNRVVKLEGGAGSIDAPVYSPDGARIAFALGGINLIAAGPEAVGEEAVTLVLADDPLPPGAANGSAGDAPDAAAARIFRPNSWSPDGVHLLVTTRTLSRAAGWPSWRRTQTYWSS